ncbi:MAG TPA: enoyl-CoA hydratase/isomerase family protein [Stellaceae bacterium]|nr:enoyl-CoA hydratase/isomerase family protein [Stellaceae bacterium]
MDAPRGPSEAALLARAGLPQAEAAAWLAQAPALTGEFARDAAAFSRAWRCGEALLAMLPRKRARGATEAAAAASIHARARRLRADFLAAHSVAAYCRLTDNLRRFVRVERLVGEAAALVPGLVPSETALAAEAPLPLAEKEGVEIDQGLFLAGVLADAECGAHLCHAMLLPRAETAELLPRLRKEGALDLGAASVRRSGKAVVVELRHPRFLNAEDDTTLDALETAADLAILDPEAEIAVLRGGPVEHPKYAGRRVFCAGINLTHLYHGKIPYIWYPKRELGIVNKIYRGLATPGAVPDDISGVTIEKPWIAAIEAFAIGGGCQYLLVMDRVIAERGAYMTLPARKEGIIPGAANLRLPRFTGDRIARQAILAERRLDCDSAEGRLLCDEIVPPGAMDAAIAGAVAALAGAGLVSAAGNRRAIRVGQEPLDLFRRYIAVYAREQAFCHFSPQLIANLERNWNAAARKM